MSSHAPCAGHCWYHEVFVLPVLIVWSNRIDLETKEKCDDWPVSCLESWYHYIMMTESILVTQKSKKYSFMYLAQSDTTCHIRRQFGQLILLVGLTPCSFFYLILLLIENILHSFCRDHFLLFQKLGLLCIAVGFIHGARKSVKTAISLSNG
jgi:hypothetical protein